jgi:hypothetical protein
VIKQTENITRFRSKTPCSCLAKVQNQTKKHVHLLVNGRIQLASTLEVLCFHRFDPSQYSLTVHGTQINRKIDKIKTIKTTLPLDFAG